MHEAPCPRRSTPRRGRAGPARGGRFRGSRVEAFGRRSHRCRPGLRRSRRNGGPDDAADRLFPCPSLPAIGSAPGMSIKGAEVPAGGRPPPRSGRRGRAVSWLGRKRRRRCLSCAVVPAPSSGQTNARRSADARGSPSRRRSGLLLWRRRWIRPRWAAQPAVACPSNPPHRRPASLSDRHQRAVRVLERSPGGRPGRVQPWREAG